LLGLEGKMDLDQALAIWVYTLGDDTRVYQLVNFILYDQSARTRGPSGLGGNAKLVLPFLKLLDTAIHNLPERFVFDGEAHRGMAFAHKDLAEHFPDGKTVIWYDLKSHSKHHGIAEQFCQDRPANAAGEADEGQAVQGMRNARRQSWGARTIFTVDACKAYAIKDFSDIPGEEEVLFPVLTQVEVVETYKLCKHGAREASVDDQPDQVNFKQVVEGSDKISMTPKMAMLACLNYLYGLHKKALERNVGNPYAPENESLASLAEQCETVLQAANEDIKDILAECLRKVNDFKADLMAKHDEAERTEKPKLKTRLNDAKEAVYTFEQWAEWYS